MDAELGRASWVWMDWVELGQAGLGWARLAMPSLFGVFLLFYSCMPWTAGGMVTLFYSFLAARIPF